MKTKIKSYFEKLNPKKLGLKVKIKVSSVKKLGIGTSNLNYLVSIGKKKFIFRMNMEPGFKNKSKKEFDALKIVEKIGIAPKVYLLDDSRKEFDSDFIILGYLEGKTSNKVKEYYQDKMFKKLAGLLAKMHSIPVKGKVNKLGKKDYGGYESSVKFLKKSYLNYINKHISNKKFLEMLDETFLNLKKSIPKEKYSPRIVVSQGDFCEQNIIVNNGKYSLIDFEDLELGDASSEIAQIFVTFGEPFDEKQKEIFLKEYIKSVERKFDYEELKDEIEKWVPFLFFNIFLWSIKHVLRIKNKEMHEEFVKNNDLKGDLAYVKVMLKRCVANGVIDKKWKDFDIVKVLKE